MLGRFATAGVAVGKFRSHAQIAADNEEFARELEESATSQSTKNLFKGILKKPSTYYGAKDRPMLERENSNLAHLEEIAKSMGLNDKELSDLSQLSSDFNVYIVVDDSDKLVECEYNSIFKKWSPLKVVTVGKVDSVSTVKSIKRSI